MRDAVIDVSRRWLRTGHGLWQRLPRRREHQRTRLVLVEPGGRPATAQPPAAVSADTLARLPVELRRRVERIQRKAEFLLGRERQLVPGGHDLRPVRHMLTGYLPTTLDAYLALPSSADSWMVTPEKTVLQVLVDQLDIIETTIDEVTDDVRRDGAYRLVSTGVQRAES